MTNQESGQEQEAKARKDQVQEAKARANEIDPPPSLGRDPDWAKVREKLAEAISEHNTALDAFMYNGGTVLVLVFTAAAGILPSVLGKDSSLSWLPQALAALAGLLVALERSLSFGQRWTYHIEMKAGYRWIDDMISFYECLPDDQKPKYLADIWNDLYALRRRDSKIPGVATTKA
jgi:hypothetical protein